MTPPPAPITTADMRELLNGEITDLEDSSEELRRQGNHGDVPDILLQQAAVYRAILARLEQQEPPFDPNTRIRVPLDLVSAPVVAPQPETPAHVAIERQQTHPAAAMPPPAPAVEIAPPDEDEAAYLTGYKSGYLAGRKDTLSAVVSVEALRALPRWYQDFQEDGIYGWESDPEGDWVKWSDLAALWPPQTGDGT